MVEIQRFLCLMVENMVSGKIFSFISHKIRDSEVKKFFFYDYYSFNFLRAPCVLSALNLAFVRKFPYTLFTTEITENTEDFYKQVNIT